MLSIAVVDDEKKFSDHLRQCLTRYGEEHNLTMEVTCFADGLDIAEEYQPKWDIIFLDIQMTHLDGMAAARRIRSMDDKVVLIFITTLAQYAINGYEVNAFDYVLKPIQYAQFELRMNKAVKEAEKHKAQRHIMLKKYSDWVKVSTDDILYIEVSGHTLRYVTAEDTLERRATIGQAEEELAGLSFSRCGISYLVNLKRIEQIARDEVMIGEHRLPISRNRKKAFLQAFSDYLEANY